MTLRAGIHMNIVLGIGSRWEQPMKQFLVMVLLGVGSCSALAQDATPDPQPKPTRIRISGVLAEKMLISHPQPVYPKEAKHKKIEGAVKLHAVISREGAVQQLDVVSGEPVLVTAAQDAVREWKYRPTVIDGKPVEAETDIVVIFQLKGKKPKS